MCRISNVLFLQHVPQIVAAGGLLLFRISIIDAYFLLGRLNLFGIGLSFIILFRGNGLEVLQAALSIFFMLHKGLGQPVKGFLVDVAASANPASDQLKDIHEDVAGESGTGYDRQCCNNKFWSFHNAISLSNLKVDVMIEHDPAREDHL